MSNKSLLSVLIILSITFGFSQTKAELEKQKAEKQAEADKFQAEANALQAQIDALPGWRVGAFGTIGGSLSNFSKWYAQGAPNNQSGTLGFTVNAFANLLEDIFFWRNSLNTNFNWTKLDDKDNPNDSDTFEPTTDVFNFTSLYGRKLNEKWAISGLIEYRTTIINNFNDPGYLDIGLGITWTPITDLVVVIHPSNYNFVFSTGDTVFESSFGAKIVADYTKQIGKVSFKTNFSAFQSYKNNHLSSWTWINSFSYKLWKAIGVGFDFGLRNNRQEAANFQDTTLENADNDIQSYYTVGISYSF